MRRGRKLREDGGPDGQHQRAVHRRPRAGRRHPALARRAAGRWLGLLYSIEFAVTFFYVKLPAGFPGARLDLMLLAGGILIFQAGPGKAAVDAVWLENEGGMRNRMMERAA